MGKSLIIKGADFSANGFRYTEVVTDASTLYINNDAVATQENWSTLDTASNSKAAYESSSGSFQFIAGYKYTAYAKADCSDAQKVTVKTRAAAPPQSTIYGVAIILFTDAGGNIVGGLTNADVDSTSPSGKTTPVGTSTDFKEYEASVPANAKYVYSVFCGGNMGSGTVSPFATGTTFEMKLIKYERE